MNTDDLYRLASIFRWAGLGMTTLGLLITLGSHLVADKLLSLQQIDKRKAQERLKTTEAELETTKIKTIQLENRLAPRFLSSNQRDLFAANVRDKIKGKVEIRCIGNDNEALTFSQSVRDLLVSAGFEVSVGTGMFMVTDTRASGINLGITSKTETPLHLETLINAFSSIDLHPRWFEDSRSMTNSRDSVAIWIGAKP